jgi:HK97 gp10 family phage protein
MSIPSPIKITKKGVEYISSVDRAKYLLVELERAALKEIGKFVRRRVLDDVRKLKGFKRGKRPLRAYQIWVRKREGNLQIGIKHDTWYGVAQELGTSKQPRRAILKNTVMNNVDEIRRIAGLYIKEIEDENKALGLIDDNDEGDGEDE